MTNIAQLAAEINRQLALFANQKSEKVQEIAEKMAQDGVAELKVKSPRDTGDYAESWTYKQVKLTKGRGVKFVVHNKDHYRLTHLLEKSYAKQNGGRSTPQPHIGPVEQQMIQGFEDELRRGLSQ